MWETVVYCRWEDVEYDKYRGSECSEGEKNDGKGQQGKTDLDFSLCAVLILLISLVFSFKIFSVSGCHCRKQVRIWEINEHRF